MQADRSTETSAGPPGPQSSGPPSFSPSPLRVMVADDAALVRRHLVELLVGLREVQVIAEAADGESALHAFRRHAPDAVVLDVRMPRTDGIEVLQIIKRERPATAVVMLTNSAYAGYRTACLQAGATHFFDKSTEFEQVPEVLRRMAHRAG